MATGRFLVYLVKRQEGSCGWEEYDGFVCVAENEEEARTFCPQKEAAWNSELGIFTQDDDSTFEAEEWPVLPQELKVTVLGEAQEGLPSGIVLSSFHG
jgi:hypothetical protein